MDLRSAEENPLEAMDEEMQELLKEVRLEWITEKKAAADEELRTLYNHLNSYIHKSLIEKITPIINKYKVTPQLSLDDELCEAVNSLIDVISSAESDSIVKNSEPYLKIILSKNRIIQTQIENCVKKLKSVSDEDLEVINSSVKAEFKPEIVSEDWVTRFRDVITKQKNERDPAEENRELLLDPAKLLQLREERKRQHGIENSEYLSELAEIYLRKYKNTENLQTQLTECLMGLKKKFSTEFSIEDKYHLLSETISLYSQNYCRWTHLLRSHALYVTSSLLNQERREEFLNNAISVHMETNKNINTQTLQHQIIGNLTELSELRIRHKKIVSRLTELSNSFTVTNNSDQENVSTEIFKFGEQGERLLNKISLDTKNFVGSLFHQSVESLSVKYPLCIFAIGSLARAEATSYSDIEFGFLIREDCDFNHITPLALDMYYRLNYLGESNLKTFDVLELKVCNFFDDGPKGVRIDGISGKAGNMPTGNGVDPESELCFSVDGFLDKFRFVMNKPHLPNSKNVRSDFADMVAHTSIVWENNEGADLYRKLKIKISELQQTERSKAARIRLLKSDMVSFAFLPQAISDHSGQIDVKSDIYRYVSLFLTGINNSLYLNCATNFDCIRELRDLNLIVDDDSMVVFRFLLASSLFTRLAAYSHYNQQSDKITVFKTVHHSQLFSINPNTFTNMMSYLIPLKKSLQEVLSGSDNDINPIPSIENDNFTATVITLFYTDSYHEVIRKFESRFGNSLNPELMSSDQSDILLKSLHNTKSLSDKHSGLIQSVHGGNSRRYDYYMGESLQSTQPNQALDYYKQHLEKTSRNNLTGLFSVYRSIAECYLTLGDYNKCQDSLDHVERILGEMKVDDIYRMKRRGLYLNSLGFLRYRQSKYEEFLSKLLDNLSIDYKIYGLSVNNINITVTLQNIALAHQELGNNEMALRYHTRSLDMKYALYGTDCNNEGIAVSLMNIGNLYRSTNDYKSSLDYLTRSYNMMCVIYKHTPNHPNIALCSHHIAQCYYKQSKYETAVEWYTKALHVYQSQSDNDVNKGDYAVCLYWLGRCYYELSQYDSTVEWYMKQLHVYQSQSDNDVNKGDYALCLYWLGMCYNRLSQYESAVEWYMKALHVYQSQSDNDVNKSDYAQCLYELGLCCYQLSQNDEAVKYYRESYDIEVSINNNGELSESIILTLGPLADIYFITEQYNEALIWFRKLSELFDSLSDISSEDKLKVKSVCLHNIAVCYERLNDERSVDYFKQSTELYPITGSDYISTAGNFKTKKR